MIRKMENKHIPKIGYFYLLLICIWTLIISFIGLSSLPLNPLSLKRSNQSNILSLLPQGWGFFTRNAREPSILVYRQKENKYIRVNKTASDKSYWFGLLKYSRAINREVGSVLKQIPDSAWQNIKETNNLLNFKTDSLVIVYNSSHNPILLGNFLLISQERLPWAWSTKYGKIVMPYRKINVIIKRNETRSN